MADTKISALPASTTPLAGTEVVPLVQSGVTKKVSVADLTAGRDVAVKKLQPTDNVEMASGKGIDFSSSSHAAGMTSELLNDYEEGTWTPVLERSTGGAISGVVTATGKYIKVGSLVTLFCFVEVTSVSSQGSSFNAISGVPFTAASAYVNAGAVGYNSAFTTANVNACYVHSSGNIFFHESINTDNNVAVNWKAGYLNFTVSYYV